MHYTIRSASDNGRRLFTPFSRKPLSVLLLIFASHLCAEDQGLISPDAQREPRYAEALRLYEKAGYTPTAGIDVYLRADSYSSSSSSMSISRNLEGEPGPILLWTEEGSWLEWRMRIPTSGLYNIQLKYFPLPGKRAAIRRAFTIDGRYPFAEAKRILFERTWRDEGAPRQDNRGDDLRPGQREIALWQVETVQDPDGMAASDLLFYLSKGEHRLKVEAIREPMALEWIRIFSPQEPPSYQEALSGYRLKGYREAEDAFIKVQAEDAWLKSDPTIRREYGSDPLSEPTAGTSFRLNEFGSWRWRRGGQWVAWKLAVPEDGLYKIGFRSWQGFYDTPVFRSLTIDGECPFKEMREVIFPYTGDWETRPLSDTKGEPYLFHLSRGEHVLKLTVTVGPLSGVVLSLEDAIQEMAMLSREIVLITGPDPDPNRDWNIKTWIPDLVPRLSAMADDLEQQARRLTAITGRSPRRVNAIFEIVAQLRSMADNPDSVPRRLREFSSSQTSLGYWTLDLQSQPLLLDYLFAAAPEQEVPNRRASFWQKLALTWRNFIASFRKNYTGVGNVADRTNRESVLNVWVARGREWVEIIKDMAEDDFTPSTGIKVNMSVFPAGQMQALLFAAAGGNPPDVALGVDGHLPVEFAIRGALVDLNDFPDYREVAKRFRSGALIPYQYHGGDYALPENQDFGMLFYRNDILEYLELSPPETWEDLYDMMPRLYEQGLDFNYGAVQIAGIGSNQIVAGFAPFLFQRGGVFYTPDGLRSALDSPEALAAFKEWTSLYTNYKVPVQADFYNRMRTGEMPIGVANYWVYVLLATAAPELTGWWRMVPMPGHRREDGSIDRTTGGIAQTAVMFKSTAYRKEAWEFIKWWTSAGIQARFGNELEALLGVEARWNTANLEALTMLPWPAQDIDSILRQWQWFREVPVVLGGYYTDRHLMNAWNRVVLQGVPAREALEDAVKAINRELARKQEEFGVHN